MTVVAVGQMKCHTKDISYNLKVIKQMSLEAKSKGAELIVFPELAVTGYRVDHDFIHMAESCHGFMVHQLEAIAKEYQIWLYTTIPEKHETEGRLPYNTAVLVSPDGLTAKYQKIHLWKKEELFFTAGRTCKVAKSPIGTLGMHICFDISYPEAARASALNQADVLIYSLAFSPASRSYALDLFAQTRALENVCYNVVSNRVGKEKDTEFSGHSQIIAPDGQIIKKMETSEGVIYGNIDLDLQKKVRITYPYLEKRI